jgi:hypothetical protein
MLTTREVATIRAALTFWLEEITPHDVSAAYFDRAIERPMSAEEIRELIAQMDEQQLRYLLLETSGSDVQPYFLSESDLSEETRSCRFATVILPSE